MEAIKIDNKEVVIMNLVHYFVTEKNYNPVIVHGISDEIWLENMSSDYKIVRIVSHYIHNNEQLGFDRFRSNQITKKLKRQTFSWKMNVLNIYIDLGENVTDLKSDEKNTSVSIKQMSDIQDPAIVSVFPDIVEKTNHDEEGMQLLFKITEDINSNNEKRNKTMEKIFSTKKPIITYILMGLCILFFILTSGGYETSKLLQFGANYGPLIKQGQVIRLVASLFLHSGILHIVFNLYSLYVVGLKIEDFFGKWKYLLIFLLSGICGNLLAIGFTKESLFIGSSGAIFGLFGALLYFGYNYRGYIGAIIKSQILPIVIYNLVISFFLSGVNIYSYIGGLIGGIITANMLGTIENKNYNITNILLFVFYFGFLIYFGIFL